MFYDQEDKHFLQEIEHYIDHRLNQRRPEFDNLPICPYVKRFRSQIEIRIAKTNLFDTLSWVVRNYGGETAWVFGLYSNKINNPDMCDANLDGFAPLMYNRGATLLFDHPMRTQPVGGVNTGFGKGALLTIQNTEILNTQRRALLKTNYYQHWSDDDLRELCE